MGEKKSATVAKRRPSPPRPPKVRASIVQWYIGQIEQATRLTRLQIEQLGSNATPEWVAYALEEQLLRDYFVECLLRIPGLDATGEEVARGAHAE